MGSTGRWKHYTPALMCFALACLILAAPKITALFIAIGLTFFGVVYWLLVSRFHKLADDVERMKKDAYQQGGGPYPHVDDPTFTTISSHMFRKETWRKPPGY